MDEDRIVGSPKGITGLMPVVAAAAAAADGQRVADVPQVWSASLSRRSLLQCAACTATIATVLGVTANPAAAAKMSKKAAAYQDTPKGNQRCDNCAPFVPPRACKIVEGDISPSGWCKLWVPKR